MGLLSKLFTKGEPCPRCGQKSPLTGARSRWEPIGGTGGYRCKDCGTALQAQAAGLPVQHQAPHSGQAPAPTAAPTQGAPHTTPQPEYTPDNSIHMAAEVGDVGRIQRFLSQGVSASEPDPVGLQPLAYASNKGRIEVMRILIEHGADPNAQGHQKLAPLHGAAFHGSLEAIQFLVDRGADVNIRTSAEFTPLRIARLRNQSEAAALLERLGGVE